ncbi:MAG: Rap1a/Tai family immunity protein [Chlorobiaceae bacterium]
MISGYDLVAVWREYKKQESGQVAADLNIGDYRGYVAGVCDVCNRWLFTTPQGTTQGQVCAVVGKWLEEHPAKWHKPAMGLVIQALQEGFPYYQKKRRRMRLIFLWVDKLTSTSVSN